MNQLKRHMVLLSSVVAFGILFPASLVSALDYCQARTVSIDANKIDAAFAASIGLRFEINVSGFSDPKDPAYFLDPRNIPGYSGPCGSACTAKGQGNGGASCWVNAYSDSNVIIYVNIWANGRQILANGKLNKQYGNHIGITRDGNLLVVDCGDLHWRFPL